MARKGRPKNPPKIKDLLNDIIPINDIFNEDEIPIYEALIAIYINDFDEELTSSDMDDIMSLATNKILELRLLKDSKNNVTKQLDIATAVEKLRKQNKDFKTNLSSRRSDRINPNEFKGFSIADLALAYDQDKRKEMESRITKLKKGEKAIKEKASEHLGNRYDKDDQTQEE